MGQAQRRVSTGELYASGLESLLMLEAQHEKLVPLMVSLADCDRLRHFLVDLPPMIGRQRRRLELLLRSVPDHFSESAPARDGLIEDVEQLRLVKNPHDRDAELVKTEAWILGLQIEQYQATRHYGLLLGNVEAARHLQRSLNAVGAANDRLQRIVERTRYLVEQPVSIGFTPTPAMAAV